MQKQSLKKRLRAWFEKRPTEWVHKQDVCDIARKACGAMSETTARRLRELSEQGFLETDDSRGSVFYKVKPQFDLAAYFEKA